MDWLDDMKESRKREIEEIVTLEIEKEYESVRKSLEESLNNEINTMEACYEERVKEEVDRNLTEPLKKLEKELNIKFLRKQEKLGKKIEKDYEEKLNEECAKLKKDCEKEKAEVSRLKALLNIRLKHLNDSSLKEAQSLKEQQSRKHKNESVRQPRMAEDERKSKDNQIEREEEEKERSIFFNQPPAPHSYPERFSPSFGSLEEKESPDLQNYNSNRKGESGKSFQSIRDSRNSQYFQFPQSSEKDRESLGSLRNEQNIPNVPRNQDFTGHSSFLTRPNNKDFQDPPQDIKKLSVAKGTFSEDHERPSFEVRTEDSKPRKLLSHICSKNIASQILYQNLEKAKNQACVLLQQTENPPIAQIEKDTSLKEEKKNEEKETNRRDLYNRLLQSKFGVIKPRLK